MNLLSELKEFGLVKSPLKIVAYSGEGGNKDCKSSTLYIPISECRKEGNQIYNSIKEFYFSFLKFEKHSKNIEFESSEGLKRVDLKYLYSRHFSVESLIFEFIEEFSESRISDSIDDALTRAFLPKYENISHLDPAKIEIWFNGRIIKSANSHISESGDLLVNFLKPIESIEIKVGIYKTSDNVYKKNT